MTAVDICNRALGSLGHDRTITSLDTTEDTSTEAARCALAYAPARDNVLAAFPWEFACREVPVEAAETALPADCVRFISVRDSSDMAVPAARAGNKVTPSRAGTLRYVSNAADVGEYPHLVAEAVVAELASMLYGPILGNPSSKEEVEIQKSFIGLSLAKLEAARQAEIEEHAYAGAPSASEVARLDICNRALSALGNERTISSLATDPCAEAVRCRQLLPMAIRHTLAAHPWEFATVGVAAANGDDVPADLVRMVRAEDADGRTVVCRMSGGRLAAPDMAKLYYVSDSVDVSKYPPGVQEAVTLALAVSMAATVSAGAGTAEMLGEVSRRADAALARAIANEADEALYRADPTDPETVARTDICNRALALVGSPAVIKDYDTDLSPEAVRCRQFYPVAMRNTLQAHGWDFATEERRLVVSADESGWARVRRPFGCLRIVGVTDGRGRPLEIMNLSGGEFFVKVAPGSAARIRYVANDPRLEDCPAEFIEAVVYRLAALLSGAVGMRTDDRLAMIRLADAKLAEARTGESNEGARPGEWDNPFLAARR